MTDPTPEERAAKLDIFAWDGTAIRQVAAAIREAENAALERAASIADNIEVGQDYRDVGEAIRRLKR